MKKIAFFLLFCLIVKEAYGQKLYPLRVLPDSVIQFKIKAEKQQISLEIVDDSDLFRPRKDVPSPTTFRLEDADLVLEYQPGQTEMALSYQITLQLTLPDGSVLLPQMGDINDVTTNSGRALIWRDLLEQVSDWEGVFRLQVKRSLMGAVNCDGKRPIFSIQKKLPYYGLGMAGVVGLGLAQVFRSQRDLYYDNYAQRWANGESESSDDLLTKARQKNRSARFATWTGVGILALDGLLFARHHFKIKRAQRIFDKFCDTTPSLSFRPNGIGLNFQF
jgi:hypothetical protein